MLEANARKKGYPARAYLLIALLTTGVVSLSANDAQAQGLFEALFGRSFVQPAPVQVLPSGWPNGAARQKQGLRNSGARSDPVSTSTKPAPYVAPEVMPGPLGQFLKDPPLKRGDVVVTPQGLMVFRGPSGSAHRAKDFVSVSKSGRLLGTRARSELAKIDQVVRSSAHGQSEASQVLASSAPIVAQDESVTVQ